MLIYIKDLIVSGRHGLHPHEKTNPQRFNISVELVISDKAATSDDIADTVNWSDIRDKIVATVETKSFNLMEHLAQVLAEVILKDDQAIQKVTISIDKLDAFKSGIPGVRLEAPN